MTTLLKPFFLLLICLCSANTKAQDSCAYLFTIPQRAAFAATDQLSNIYLVTIINSIEKYDSTGNLVARYSNNRLGSATMLDVTNPLKILVWYASFQTVIYLDRNLTELGQLNLAQAGWPSIASIATASDGNLWVYDPASFKLMKMTPTGEKLIESEPLNMINLVGKEALPTLIKENGEKVFLGVEHFGVLLFDIYGHFLDIFEAFDSFKIFEIAGNLSVSTVALKRHGEIYVYNMADKAGHAFKTYFLVDKTFWLSKRKIFVQTQKGVDVYCF